MDMEITYNENVFLHLKTVEKWLASWIYILNINNVFGCPEHKPSSPGPLYVWKLKGVILYFYMWHTKQCNTTLTQTHTYMYIHFIGGKSDEFIHTSLNRSFLLILKPTVAFLQHLNIHSNHVYYT